ncbi:Hypothetical protein A7982_06627 [Minicystis rosea]|nr:Hypothetical protein A7982_06627 [Minicystis rosea]
MGDPELVAACNAACETFVGGDCYGACKATCQSPTCTASGDTSTYEDVIALDCSSGTLNFHTTHGSSACSSPDIPAAGDNGTGTSHRMFVTNASFTADLAVVGGAATGPAGADNLCNLAAEAVSIGGTWKAWISDSSVDAIDRIEDKGPWLNVPRTAILFPNKAALTQTPIDSVWYDLTDEHGTAVSTNDVWTGTKTGGRVSMSNDSFDTCDDWMTMGEFSLGATGSTGSSASIWTEWLVDECQFTSNRLYCIEQ